MNRKFDIVLWGATGFTGRLVAEYFLEQYGLNKTLKWAIAGRNKEKLNKLRQELIPDNTMKIPILIGDSHDNNSLNKIALDANVICSTVGPYLKYGSEIMKACIYNNTNYCDITGETPFIKDNIKLYHKIASEQKIKIVHCCGYDSIPSDLGCLMVQDFSIRTHGNPCQDVLFYAGKTKGGFSGGTIASMINMKEKSKFNKDMRNTLKDPYALNMIDKNKGNDDLGQRDIKWDSDLKVWTGPFIMSMINTRVVRRTNELLDLKYGNSFSYQEVMTFPSGYLNKIRAQIFRFSLGLMGKVLDNQILCYILKKFILPSAGEGPSKLERENGYFNVTLIGKGKTKSGQVYKVKGSIYGDKDPGYSGTARMLGESAVCLALDNDLLPKRYGILTPASALGKILIERLKDKGMNFNVGKYN